MSPTTETLRRRIDTELDALEPMPDLTAAAARAGRSRLRRRRLAGGSLLGVAALGGGLVAGGALTGAEPGRTPPTASDPTGTPAGPAGPAAPDPLDDGRVTADERNEAVRAGLEAMLPGRYGTVTTLPKVENRIQMFGTDDGSPRIQVALVTQGRPRGDDFSLDDTDWSCDGQGRARPILSCAEADLGGGWLAVAINERTGATEEPGSTPAYGSSMLVMNAGVWSELSVSELGWDGLGLNRPAGITAQELVAMAQDPAYLDMLEVDAAWQAERDLPDQLAEIPDARWPS